MLYYLRARYFNPVSGRFLTKDPDGGDTFDPATLHKYVYAGGEPVNRLDRSGNATTMENTLLLAGVTLTAATAIYYVERPIKCIWCEGVSQLSAALYVDLLAPGVRVIGLYSRGVGHIFQAPYQWETWQHQATASGRRRPEGTRPRRRKGRLESAEQTPWGQRWARKMERTVAPFSRAVG